MPTILGRLTGVAFQTELLVMTFLGLINSILSWSSFDWTMLVERIRNIELTSENFGDVVKTILSWVVIARIIIAHLYTITYLANFYSILTWCRPKILLPWMIVSGFKNFLLEFVVIMVCLLLYLEREFSTAWLAAFIVCKLLYLVPAFYYWRTVNTFFVELSEIQRRKLTRANIGSNVVGNSSRNPDIVERLRYRSTFDGGYAYGQQRFASLVNLDYFLFNSSLVIDGERDSYKLSKSLATLITMDSQEFEDIDDDSRLRIIEDDSLTPVEKSMKILGLNIDDINDARVRLGKNTLPTGSRVEEIEEIVSTIEPKDKVEVMIDDRSDDRDATDLSIAHRPMNIDKDLETGPSPLKISSTDPPSAPSAPSAEVAKLPAENHQPGCTCKRSANEDSIDKGILDSRRNKKKSVNDSFREIRSSGYEDDDEDSTDNIDLSRPNRSSSIKQSTNGSRVASPKLSSTDLRHSDLCKGDPNESKEREPMILRDLAQPNRSSSIVLSKIESRVISPKLSSTDLRHSDLCKEDANESKERESMILRDLSQRNQSSSIKVSKTESSVVNPIEKLSSSDIPHSDLCKENANESKERESMILALQQVNQRLKLRSFVIPGFEKEQIGWLKNSWAYSEDPKTMNVELFRVDDICLEQDNQADDTSESGESDLDDRRSRDLQAQRSLLRIDDNIPGVYTQTDFVNDAAQWRSNQNFSEDDNSPSTDKPSTSTQTNISDCWKKPIFQRSLNRDRDLLESKTSACPLLSKAMLFAAMKKFSRPNKMLETKEEREAREMRALRVYNRQTLFKYKREMEARKQNPAVSSRIGLRSLIFATNPANSVTNDAGVISKAKQGRITNEKDHVTLNQIPEPQHQISKLSTFNQGLAALEYSISLSFSNENKNRTRLQDPKNNPNEASSNLPHDGRKQLSKSSKPMRNPEDLNGPPFSSTIFEKLSTDRDLERTPGAQNIVGRNASGQINHRIDSYRIETNQNGLKKVLSETILPSIDNAENCTTSIVEPNNEPELYDKHGISGLKETMKNIDWSFNDTTNLFGNDSSLELNFISSSEDVLYDIIDDTDTISLLRSAFASNPDNTERGFYLGPGSTELYSVSNYLDNVVEEIMKTARLRPNRDAFSMEPTIEVDYGYSYLQEFQNVGQMLTLEVNAEETDSESELSEEIKIEAIAPAELAEFYRTEPIEMCWSSYSGEGFDTRNDRQLEIEEIDQANADNQIDHIDLEEYRQNLSSTNPYESKGIADLLGEQELSYLEFWTNELKDLASYDKEHDPEFTAKFRHLTEMPGYCVVKTLVDFFREFVAVSRSTMTSSMFNRRNPVSTPNSLGSEEIISGGINERSDNSLMNGAEMDHQNMAFVEAIDEDVTDSLRALIGRITESTEANRNIRAIGIHDDRTNFPLREDQFYFGPPENTRRIISEHLAADSASKSEVQDRQLIGNQEIQAFHTKNLQTSRANTSNSNTEVSAVIDPYVEVRDNETPSSIAEGQISSDLTVDSYDSFYSTGTRDTSKHSDNVISIGEDSSFEDFPEDPSNCACTIESNPP